MHKYAILGPPGAGKSTQAILLAKSEGFVRICVGEIFRWNIQNRTKLGAKIRRHIDAGLLAPDEIVDEVVRERLAQHDWNHGFVLDGYPATRPQAEFLLESYDIDGVILLHAPEAVLAGRLVNLRHCEACGFDHRLIYDQEHSEDLCDLCGAVLVKRHADDPDAIARRLREFLSKTDPILDLLRQRELVVRIEGTLTAEEIHHRVRVELGLGTEAMRQELMARAVTASP